MTRQRAKPVDAAAVAEVRDTLGAAPRRRDLLIEHLHRLQDRFGSLRPRHLHALAEEMRLSQAEVWEVATFYAHFRVSVLAPSPASLALVGPPPCPPPALPGEGYCVEREGAGEAILARCRRGDLSRDVLLAELERSQLRGLGGAGFPTARKWRTVLAQPGPRLVVVNADEGEPGTFKDLHYLTHHRKRMLEGALIAAWVLEAPAVYIYLRDEYSHLRADLLADMAAMGAAMAGDGPELHLRRGAGAYICGEESALIESIEGKRGLPRHRPPYVAERGLFGRPTLVNNVETLVRAVDILSEGAGPFLAKGRHGHVGERAYSVSGRVRDPGVKMAPNGITIGELIEEFCGGMQSGHRFTAYLPGGASGGFLPAALQPPLAFGAIEPYGGFIGSAAVVVFSDQDDLRREALDLMRFFAAESCGQCTPCRMGTARAVAMMAEPRWDADRLADLGQVMRDASICGLGQAAPNLFLSLLRHFPDQVP